jgi:hypothetical protein
LQSRKELPSPFECCVWQAVPFVQHEVPAQQLVPQATVAPGQAQVPPVQAFPFGHAVPQAPQFRVLVFVFTQEPEQSDSPAAQHVPLAHTEAPHDVPQVPQLAGSIETSTHPEAPQSFGKAVPAQVQAPDAQVDRDFWASQDAPQVPQWAGSSWRFTQGGFPPQL